MEVVLLQKCPLQETGVYSPLDNKSWQRATSFPHSIRRVVPS